MMHNLIQNNIKSHHKLNMKAAETPTTEYFPTGEMFKFSKLFYKNKL